MSEWTFFSKPTRPISSPGVRAKFNRFLAEIELTRSQKEEASRRYGFLKSNLLNGFPGSKIYLSGSYDKNTAIKPPSDLDIMLVLPADVLQRFSGLKYLLGPRNGPSELLQEVKRKLDSYYPVTALRADGQVVSLPFVNSFSVEVLPCFEIPGSRKFKIADSNGGGSWKEVDPIGEAQAIVNSNKLTNGNTIRLIKMIKCWRNFCDVPLKSFYIEILVCEFLAGYAFKDESLAYFDNLTKEFFRFLYNKTINLFGTYISHPSTEELISIGSAWRSKADSAYERAHKAIEYEVKGNARAANNEWQKIFGPYFQG